MVECPSCSRHIRTEERTCPFCRRPSTARRAFHVVGGVVTTLVLSACYGPPPGGGYYKDSGDTSDTGITDMDMDGFDSDVDCNDADPAIHPEAEEICDDTVDNDCDELIDALDVDDCPGT